MINYTLASPDNPQDDAALRELMRLQGMSGWVDLSLEREPSFFIKQWPDMPEYAVIARDEDAAVGMYTYGIHPVYVNGLATRLGYLGGLRVHSKYRHHWHILKHGYASIAKVMPETSNDYYYTSISSDNLIARRLLEARVVGKPDYYPLGEMVTLAIPVTQGKSMKDGWRQLVEQDVPALLQFHHQHAMQFQFAPVLTEALVRHIGISNFYGYWQGQLEACVAVWDQSAYKQVVVRAYHHTMALLRNPYNIYAKLTKRIPLPPIDKELSQCYLAFLALSPNTMSKANELVRDILRYCRTEAAILGLHTMHPLLKGIGSLHPFEYRTQIYAVGRNDKPKLNHHPVQPEVAWL